MTTYSPRVIAEVEARRLSMVLQELSAHHTPIDTGTAAWDGDGSWANYAAGLGLAGAVGEDSLDELIAFYRDHGATPRVRVTPYQSQSLIQGLSKRGFTLYDTETVLARDVDASTNLNVPNGLSFREVDPSKPDDVDAFLNAHIGGFYQEGEPSAPMRAIMRRMIALERVTLWLVTHKGTILASGGLETYDDAGVLICGSVLPAHRQQGIHSALLAFRVEEAAKRGLNFVTIGSAPGATSERNALRAGFSPVYTELGLEQREIMKLA